MLILGEILVSRYNQILGHKHGIINKIEADVELIFSFRFIISFAIYTKSFLIVYIFVMSHIPINIKLWRSTHDVGST